jgi:hypothetical protein
VKVFAICYPKAIANAAASSMVATLAPFIFIEVVAAILLALTLAVVVMFDVMLIALSTLPLRLSPAEFKLPPKILPVTEINPGVVTLPPAMFAVTLRSDITFELKLKPAAFKFPLVMLPLALTEAALMAADVIRFPPVTLPTAVIAPLADTVAALTPPTVIMFAPVTLPVADTKPGVRKLPVSMFPMTLKLLSTPTLTACTPVNKDPLPL